MLKEPNQNCFQAKMFVKALEVKAQKASKSTFSVDELREIATLSKISDFDALLSSLNLQGVLLKKGQFQYQLISAV